MEDIEKLYRLEFLSLDLQQNKLGQNGQVLIHLADGLIQLKNLKELVLNLSDNYLGFVPNNDSQYLGYILKQLPGNLQKLQLGLTCNLLEFYNDNMKYFGEGIAQLKNLKKLVIELEDNDLGKNEEAMNNLGQGIKQLVNLEELELRLNNKKGLQDKRVQAFKEEFFGNLKKLVINNY